MAFLRIKRRRPLFLHPLSRNCFPCRAISRSARAEPAGTIGSRFSRGNRASEFFDLRRKFWKFFNRRSGTFCWTFRGGRISRARGLRMIHFPLRRRSLNGAFGRERASEFGDDGNSRVTRSEMIDIFIGGTWAEGHYYFITERWIYHPHLFRRNP